MHCSRKVNNGACIPCAHRVGFKISNSEYCGKIDSWDSVVNFDVTM